eukprot:s4_g14.t1
MQGPSVGSFLTSDGTCSEPRVLWSVVHNLAQKKGMTFNRRFVISGFELPRTLGPNDRQQSEGKVTQQMVVNEYLLAPTSSDA